VENVFFFFNKGKYLGLPPLVVACPVFLTDLSYEDCIFTQSYGIDGGFGMSQ
jgi:hypothetical protein